MTIPAGNIFAALPDARRTEQTTEILWSPQVRVERIVSQGQKSPPGTWYDQDRAEWVILLTGSAVLRFEKEAQPRTLKPGDHVLIPAHARHRVDATDAQVPSVWLAVHYE